MTLAERQQAIWTGALGALIIFSFISGPIWFYSEGPPQPCDARLSELKVNVYVGENLKDKPRLAVNIVEESKILPPIQVKPDDSIAIEAEIRPKPEGCNSILYADWELSFVAFDLPVVKSSAEKPPSERLELRLGSPISAAVGEDQIVLIIRNSFGRAIREVKILLKGE